MTSTNWPYDIVTIASSLPGYQDYCGHQHEIEKRAEEWARCVENSHYYHYGSSKFKSTTTHPAAAEPQPPTWNERQDPQTFLYTVTRISRVEQNQGQLASLKKEASFY
ncbi:MAG: hypothetical protein SFW36_18950 [Leptolyngbyaceae cyanobacterium bins.59]|nr:hypothetical protein [Leptolyngbyaceae cyanobacterium bins.59]